MAREHWTYLLDLLFPNDEDEQLEALTDATSAAMVAFAVLLPLIRAGYFG